MTDKEKLQQLFDAALKDPETHSGHVPKRAFPISKLDAIPVPAAVNVPHPSSAIPRNAIPFLPVSELRTEAPQESCRPTMANVLDYAANAELVALMDMERERKNRQQKIVTLGATALVLLGLIAIGFAWFMQAQATPETTSSGSEKPALQKDFSHAASEIGAIHKATATLVEDPSLASEK